MRELKQGQWLRIAGVNVVLKEDKENAINGKQKDSVREETSVVSGTMKISVQNRRQKPLHPLNQHKEVEVHRRERTSEAAPNHLVIIDILPNVNFISPNRVANSVISARLHTTQAG